jgi:hypothetical protein
MLEVLNVFPSGQQAYIEMEKKLIRDTIYHQFWKGSQKQ